MMICYTLVCWSINKDRLESMGDGTNEDNVINFNQHMRLISMLAIAYSISVGPVMFVSWGQFDIKNLFSSTLQRHVIESCLNLLYWSMYSINFILYMCSYNRIRDAYRRFFRDTGEFIWKRTESIRSNSSYLQDVKKMKINDI